MPLYGLDDRILFPPPQHALADGLLAVGGDLSVPRLLEAYGNGIFPWYNQGEPILWWSPSPRAVFVPREFRVQRSLRPLLNRQAFRITVDAAFERVVETCSSVPRPGQEGTWIGPDMQKAYTAMYRAGHAHSVEAWQGEDLVGGVYGVSLGSAFFGESMFSLKANASKVAFAHLMRHLALKGFPLVDAQVHNEHLERLGAQLWLRSRFLLTLKEAIARSCPEDTWPALGTSKSLDWAVLRQMPMP
jgi:leucyl/phenylalanyl-tRNA--protein transferase